jgi:hypothetical protein
MLRKLALLQFFVFIVVISGMGVDSVHADNWHEQIQNSGFESTPLSWWLAVPKTAGTITLDTSIYNNGSQSCKITDTSITDQPLIQTPLMPIDSSKTYTHSLWVKGGSSPRVVHLYFDSSKSQLSGSPTVSVVATNWTNVIKTFGPTGSSSDYIIPSNTAYMQIRYYPSDATAFTGSINFDDISFGFNISTDATLSKLILSNEYNDLDLNPLFSSNSFQYSAKVENTYSNIYITPTTNNSKYTSLTVNNNSSLSGNKYGPIALNIGTNTISINIVAEDGITSNTYTITIQRLEYSENWNELLQNTGFENSSLTWWLAVPKTAGTISLNTSIYHSGNKSVQIEDTSLTDRPLIQTPLFPVNSNLKYTHSWYVKGGSSPMAVHLYFDSSKAQLQGSPMAAVSATNWTNASKTFGPAGSGADYIIPANTAYMQIRYYPSDVGTFTGTAYYDDIFFGPTYSECIDAPTGPTGIPSPGGTLLPPIWNQTTENHAISAISDVTLPNETLVITGYNLEDTRYKVWAEGYNATYQPVRCANDRAQVIIPSNAPVSTMLVWPIKNGYIGSPVRVNGATSWWAWPSKIKANTTEQSIRIFGKNLKLGTSTPVIYLKKPDNSILQLSIINSNEYQLEASLPSNLEIGTYTLWAHNGTGGKYGWSQSVTFEAADFPNVDNLPSFLVDNYGAIPNDGIDDWQAITNAVTAAKNADGGIVLFSAGEYNISQSILINGTATKGVHLRGVGKGNFDNSGLMATNPDVVNHGVSGNYTLITYVAVTTALSLTSQPRNIINVDSSNVSVKDMTVINADYGRRVGATQWVMTINKPNVLVENVRLVSVDARNYTDASIVESLINVGVLDIQCKGNANIAVKNCEIHSPKIGINIGDKNAFDSVNYVQIDNVNFTGYYAGKHPRDTRTSGHGLMANAVSAYNAKNLIVENCYFSSGDKLNGKILNRAFLGNNNSERNLYIANNTVRNVGPHPSANNMEGNSGEQFLLHDYYTYGGLFDILQATPTSITVNTANIPPLGTQDIFKVVDNTGSQLPDEISYDKEWVAYICAGKGVGQYRILNSLMRNNGQATLDITEPWRVIPDNSSRVMIQVVYRNNIFYNNDVQNDQLNLQNYYKSIGVLLFYRAFENIISDNTFKNLAVGVALNESFRFPVCWNLTRRNTMDNIDGADGQGGDSSSKPAFYTEQFRSNKVPNDLGWSQEFVWFSVGNIARQNICTNTATDGNVAAYLDTRLGDKGLVPDIFAYNSWDSNSNRGFMMSVLENNILSNTITGINIGKPAMWSLIRNNTVTASPSINYDGQKDAMEVFVVNP